MNTESLEYFNKVYEKKSLTAAAKELFITPQGVSKTIKQLEVELEAELFTRGPRGMEATEAGELLYARSKHILYLLEDIKSEVSILSGNKGIVTVLITFSVAMVIPIEGLYTFADRFSDFQLKIKEVADDFPSSETFDEIDIGLVIGDFDFGKCEFELIKEGRSVIVASNNHPLASKDRVSLKELKEYSFAIRSTHKEEESAFVEACLNEGFNPQIKHEYGSIYNGHQLVNDEETLVVSIDFIEEKMDNPDVSVIELKEAIPQHIYSVSRKKDFRSTAVQQLQQYIRSIE